VLRAAPGIFTFTGDGRGEGVILDADTLQPGPFDPSNGQRRLIVFATGVRGATQVTVNIGGRFVTVESVMPSTTLPGLDEVHLLLPADLRGAGTVEMVLRADNRDSNPVTVTITGDTRRDLVINEVLADPPDTLAGDANHDGVRDTSQDEFVEIVNTTSSDIDISGYELLTRGTTDTLRHKFASNTILPAGGAIVVFGGGTFDALNPIFGGAQVFKASTGSLSLVNGGGVVTLRDTAGAVASLFSYGGSTGLNADENQSLTRSPDVTGTFTGHLSASGSGGRAFSPGTRVDGSPFLSPAISRIEVTPATATIFVGQQQQFTARAFDASGQELGGVIFTWQSSNTAVATINQAGLATGVSEGTTEIRAGARGVQSAPATLTVNFVTRVLTRIEVTPNPASIPVSGGQQFTARAFDQFNNEMTGVAFTWASADTNIATIDQTGLAIGVSQGQTTITASAQNVSGTATLNVTAPTVVINEVLADPPDGTDGDANHDGVRDSGDDEFVELVNSTGSAINIAGWTIKTRPLTGSTAETTRHTFAAGTALPAGSAVVVFGGGTFDPNNALFACALVVKASTAGLSLTNGGLNVIVRDAAGNLVTRFTFGGTTGLNGDANQSLTRSPDITGNFVQHTTATGAGGRRFSPGARVNGTPFGPCPARLTTITISPPSASVITGQSTQFTAQAFDQFGSPITGATITFSSDNTSVATVDTVTTNPGTGIATATVTGHSQGTAHITATTTDGTTTVTSNQATLTVNTTAATFTVTGQVKDTNNNPVSGVLITFELNFQGTLSATSTLTDANGNYSSGDLGCQNNVKVTPSKTGLTFTPSAISFVNSSQCLTGNETANFTAATAPTGTLVISQVYTGGGNVNATYTHDFVEIFNSGTTTVDFSVTPYSVQYASVGANFGTSKTNITSGTIAPGQYFLVQESTGGGVGAALPTPDVTGTIALSAASGKVALVVGTTALPSLSCPGDDGTSPFNPNNVIIADFVGYGGNANTVGHCYEGPAPAPAPSATGADFRKAGGCVDTNFNGDDFLIGGPNPRNTASPFNNCSAGLTPEITINDPSSVLESTANVTFTVTLSTPSAQTVTVNYATANNTATAGVDYTAVSGTLSFAPGETTKTLLVPIINDTLDEPSETFFVNLTSPTNAVILDNQGQGTITDNDNAPSLSINDVSVAEGDSGTTNATFNVTLSAASGQQVTVNYATADNTATAVGDYQSTSGTLTFTPGQTLQTITVLVNGDTTFEPNETFVVNLTTSANATVSDNQGQGTITDDDAPLTTADLSVTKTDSPDPVAIGNDITYTITVTNSGTDTAVNAVLSDTVPANTTFRSITAPAGWSCPTQPAVGGTGAVSCTNASFAVGSSVFTLVVRVDATTTDGTIISNTASVNSSSTDNNSGNNTATQTTTVKQPLLVISQVYGGGGNSLATFTNDFVEIFNRGTTTVNFAVTPYSVQYAGAGSNFGGTAASLKTNITSGTIAPGQYYLVQGATGGAVGAALPTPDVTGSLAMAATAGKVALVVGTTALPASICPGDDGTAPFNPNNATIADFIGYGSVVCYEGSAPAPAPSATTSDFRKAGGCVDTNFNGDDFLVAGPNPRNTLSPLNDCSAGFKPEITINDRVLSESTTPANFTVTLSTASTLTVMVNYATADGTATAGADYTAVSGTLTFAPGETTKTINVPIINDTLDEANETYFVNLSNASNGTILDSQGQGTINDNDPTPTLSVSDASVLEGDSGTKSLDLTVTLSAASGQVVTVDYATTDGTATAGSDYQTATGTLTFNPGDTTKIISVNINGDTVVEPNETFLVNLTNASNATIFDDQGQGTIQDDDAPPTLSISDVSHAEGNTGTTTFTFTVSLSAPAKVGGITFDIATQDDMATVAGNDYTAKSLTAQSIPEGSLSYTFEVAVNGDTIFEPDENFFVKVTNVSGATVVDDQGVGTITNDDAQPMITIADAAVTEGNAGTSLMTFTVTLNGTSQSTVSVNYATADSSATAANTDYDSTSGTLNFAPGDPTETFTVTIHGDTSAEGDEMFLANLSGASGATITDNQALGTIFLDDPFSVASLNTAYLENFDTLAQSGVSSTTPPVWTRAESGANANTTYTANNGGSNTGDTYSYGTTGSSERALGTLRATTFVPTIGTFYRNDTGFTINSLQIAYTGEEWRLGTASRVVPDRLDFQYSTNATSLTTGTWTDVDALDFSAPNNTGTGAKDGNDPANRTAINSTISGLSIAPGATFWIRWNDFEATGADDGLAVDDFSLTAGINTPALSIDNLSHVEGNSGTTTFIFNVSLSSVAGPGGVSFTVNTADGTTNPATAGSDYVAIANGSGSIAQGNMSTTVNVTVNGDTNIEPDETFFVNVTNVSGATVVDDQGQGTINNDDAAVTSADLSLTKTVNNLTPNIGERVVFTITLNNIGTDAASSVQVIDLLPVGLTFVSAVQSQGTYTSGTGVWDVGTVSVASPAATLNITATVTTTGAKINTAEVTASGTPDPDSTPNDGTGDDFASITITAASNLVINEVHTQAQASPPANANDFVELYNKSAQAIDVSGLVISYRGSTSTTTVNTFTLPASTVIPANSYLIIVNGAITYGVTADFDASGGAGFNLTATSGGVKIELNGVKLDGIAYQSAVANTIPATFLAFGEGTPFTSPVASGQQDYVRSPNGADSNDNATDFRRSGANSTTVTPKAANPTITP
jgi:uncharacterized repeat protein (TIGR01451 family)